MKLVPLDPQLEAGPSHFCERCWRRSPEILALGRGAKLGLLYLLGFRFKAFRAEVLGFEGLGA